MKKTAVLPAWGRVLRGRTPLLSLEITKECPLRCPGCYAYQPEHLNNGVALRQLRDLRGRELVDGVLAVVRHFRPIHVSIVGGEPLVRYRELDELLPKFDSMGIEVQLVTSAVRPIPAHWAALKCLHLVVSIDGLQPEHDRRRAPATYERILKHIAGHSLIVHCTVTRQQVARDGYLHEFAAFWSARPEVRKIWFSLYTPQEGEVSEERLTPDDRLAAVRQLAAVRTAFPKVYMPDVVLRGYLDAPKTPADCMFAKLTTCVSADLSTLVTPCQLGGKPVCSECGCIASAGLAAIGNFRIAGVVPVSRIFDWSMTLGRRLASGNTPGNSRVQALAG
ncbi:MAG TPA: radical SAM protein [Bryobacteraceae bacterium]|nr:radical SAM protein [Bryobacteraceae bacterium]HOQ45861.1 radical SAM protein [Bryobacteraceae bacterium]HPQ13731.1 radical SAM protein [Bryobacteraceae bacterium]HPU70930.1 radical SAM protein [Bryobacteraceae bacterium]